MYGVLKRILNKNAIVKPALFIVVVLVIFLFSLLLKSPDQSIPFENELSIRINENLVLKTDVSSTSNERTIGLSKYDNLSSDQSMLFVFQEKGLYSFWMRGMKFPIDIIWLDENKKIVSIQENADPSDYPQSYYPTSEALYVLETVAGFSAKNNLENGQQLSW